MARSLVIVESPAKAKTINKYLGRDYTVKASLGHVMDLPKKTLGVLLPGEENSKRKKKALRGREFDLLLEGTSDETDMLLEGRTAMHAPEIDGKLYISDIPDGIDPVPGEFYRCQITETHDYDLVARIL